MHKRYITLNNEHVNIHKEKDPDIVFSVPSKPKPTKNLWRQDQNHACMRRFLETVKRPVEFAYMIQISLINKPSMVFP